MREPSNVVPIRPIYTHQLRLPRTWIGRLWFSWRTRPRSRPVRGFKTVDGLTHVQFVTRDGGDE